MKKRLNCDHCGKNLARGCNLEVLTQILHEKDFEFNCDHCGKNFTRVFNLEICIQTLHESHKTLD